MGRLLVPTLRSCFVVGTRLPSVIGRTRDSPSSSGLIEARLAALGRALIDATNQNTEPAQRGEFDWRS